MAPATPDLAEADRAVKRFGEGVKRQVRVIGFDRATFEAVAPETEEHQAAADIGRALGQDVVFFRARNTGTVGIGGAAYEGRILINVDGPTTPPTLCGTCGCSRATRR